jgi:hypothetical protein
LYNDNLLKFAETYFSEKLKILFTICVDCVWIVIYIYFLFEKQAFNGLLMDICLQSELSIAH